MGKACEQRAQITDANIHLTKPVIKDSDKNASAHALNEGSTSPGPQSWCPTSAEICPPTPSAATHLKRMASVTCASTPYGADAARCCLRRPAELNLGPNTAQDQSKAPSELEQRHDVIRNSRTQSKAALRSPTQLLQERLNMAPKKEKHEKPMRSLGAVSTNENGCLFPAPGAFMDVFSSTLIRAQTEASGKPAWWCKIDKLVVLDGIRTQDNGELEFHTRTSKGLAAGRRLGDMETIVIPMNCRHCQKMLKRHEWKYDMRVCKKSACWDCKERCKWEAQEVEKSSKTADSTSLTRQMGQVGIEQGEAKSETKRLNETRERMASMVMAS